MAARQATERRQLDLSDAEWDDAPTLALEPTPAQLQAELATLPARPDIVAPKGKPRHAPGTVTLTQQETAELLGISRASVRKFISKGKLRTMGRDGRGWYVLDRTEVEALAADRESAQFERQATGSALDQHRIEKAQGISSDPRTFERDARERSGNAERQRAQLETVSEIRAVKSEIEFGFQRLLSEMREQNQRLAALQESLSSLNTGALIAAGALTTASLTPEAVKGQLLDKIRKATSPREAAVAPVAVESHMATPPVGPQVRTIAGELVARHPLGDEDLRDVTRSLDEMFERLRPTGKP